MKISIWQQFSSNHSGSFHVVGKFKSGQDASEAAKKLKTAIARINAWYNENPDEYEYEGPPSPPEQEIIEEYDLEWDEEFGLVPGSDKIAEISVFEDLLLLEIAETRANMQLEVLKQWVEKLGTTSVGMYSEMEGEPMNILQVHLSFEAPDQATADDIYTRTLNTLDTMNRVLLPEKAPFWFELDNLQDVANGQVDRSDLRFNCVLPLAHPSEDLPTLITQLRDMGCTNIAYRIEDVERNWDEE